MVTLTSYTVHMNDGGERGKDREMGGETGKERERERVFYHGTQGTQGEREHKDWWVGVG